MYASKNLENLLKTSKEIIINDNSKIIVFSDCHRGDNSWSDDFADNQNIFFHALEYYFKEGFTYIELGDGDELWENKDFEEIKRAYKNIFWRIREYYDDKRFYLVWGNHNRQWKNKGMVKKYLSDYYDDVKNKRESLFKDIEVHESLILRLEGTDNKLFLAHGHQWDIFNDSLWWFSKNIVRHVWKPLQVIGVKDPTSPAKNYKKLETIEKNIVDWVIANNQVIIAGHTHRPVFPSKEKPPYFNSGSCVHPRCITGLEIQNGNIVLIKWLVKPDDNTAMKSQLIITREELVKPEKLNSYFKS